MILCHKAQCLVPNLLDPCIAIIRCIIFGLKFFLWWAHQIVSPISNSESTNFSDQYSSILRNITCNICYDFFFNWEEEALWNNKIFVFFFNFSKLRTKICRFRIRDWWNYLISPSFDANSDLFCPLFFQFEHFWRDPFWLTISTENPSLIPS